VRTSLAIQFLALSLLVVACAADPAGQTFSFDTDLNDTSADLADQMQVDGFVGSDGAVPADAFTAADGGLLSEPCGPTSPCAQGVCDLVRSLCVSCVNNDDCKGPAYCSKGACVPSTVCASDLDCKPLVCSPDGGVCVPCVGSADCPKSNACVQQRCEPFQACTSSTQCPLLCDKSSGTCVDCLGDLDCGANLYCDALGGCVPKVCTANLCKDGVYFGCLADGSGYAPGQDCTQTEPCLTAGSCTDLGCTAELKKCDDANPCTTDSCATKFGCQHTPNTLTCDDGNPCTTQDVCQVKACAGKPMLCDDGDVCTVDACGGMGTCSHQPLTGPVCSDGNSCTAQDTCLAGVCSGLAVVCDDGEVCTQDVCNAKSGCAYVPAPGACDDGNPCTGPDTCLIGTCAGKAIGCDDGLACTEDACSGLAGCVHQPSDALCDDANACTEDSCSATTGCAFTPIVATCNDADACTLLDTCVAGVCTGDFPLVCDDGNPCTDDVCEAANGCVAKANTLPCDDAQPCTLQDTCAGSSCAGKPKVFAKTLGVSGLESASHVVRSGQVLVVLAIEATTEAAHLVATDAWGEVLWHKSLVGFTGNPKLRNLIALNNGDLVVVGAVKEAKCGADAYVVRLSAQGEVKWQTTLGAPCTNNANTTTDYANNVLAVGDTLLVAGQKANMAWLFSLDAEGGLLWQKTYNFLPSPDESTLYCLAPTSGGFLVGGGTIKFSSPWQGWYGVVDPSGALQWSQTAPDIVRGCAAFADGFLLAQSNQHIRTTMSGQVLWTKDAEPGLVVLPLADGYATAGFQFLSRYDHAGNTLWTRKFLADNGRSLAVLDDGFALALSKTTALGASEPMLVRTDAFGWSSCKDAGACANLPLYGCDDANPCTLDLCTAAEGCSHQPLPDCTFGP